MPEFNIGGAMAQGAVGRSGIIGPPGWDGLDGEQGLDGLPGVIGPQGPPGVNGSGLTYTSLGDSASTIINGATTAVSIGLSATVEITAVPIGTVAVSVRIIAATTAIATNNGMTVNDYQRTGQDQWQLRIPGVANYYSELAVAYVQTGGTNNRQIKYSVIRGAGTITYYLAVNGYWI